MPTLDTLVHSLRFRYGRHTHTGGEGGTVLYPLNEYTSAQTLSSSNYLVLVNAIGGDIIITLPAASAHTNRIYTIKKIDSSDHSVTIDGDGTDKIDGSETIELTLQYSYATIVSDGDEWFIIGGLNVKLEEVLDKLLTEQNELLEKLRIESAQSTLHLAKLSGEKITEKDVS